VVNLRHLTPLDPAYPPRLRGLPTPPATLSIAGGALDAARTVAVVGSRECHPEARTFACKLSAAIVESGAVVVSGGALGIDAAAHEGALDAGGRTWAVAGTGCNACFPPVHADLYARIAAGPGCMVWPFAPDVGVRNGAFAARNRVLVALADTVVVVQAGKRSGALNAAGAAARLGRALWVVPAAPWAAGFEGSLVLLQSGARAIDALLTSIPAPKLPSPSAAECALLTALSERPLHLDAIAQRAQVTAQAAAAGLLTLALENVVVEDPPGFFRRRDTL
jgi:DNA processing protein